MLKSELTKTYPIGTVVKILEFPTTTNGDIAKIIDESIKKYGNNPLVYVIGYHNDGLLLSHITSFSREWVMVKFKPNQVAIVSPDVLETRSNMQLDYTSKYLGFYKGEQIELTNGEIATVIDKGNYNRVTGEGYMKIIKPLTTEVWNPNNIINLTISKDHNIKKNKSILENDYTQGIATTIFITDPETKYVLKSLLHTHYSLYDADAEYFLNNKHEVIGKVSETHIIVRDCEYGYEVIIPNTSCITLNEYVILNSILELPFEKKFTKIKCIRNKGSKTTYKLTINKSYDVLKWHIDDTTSTERVIIKNDSNIEKSYDPKLFKGIE